MDKGKKMFHRISEDRGELFKMPHLYPLSISIFEPFRQFLSDRDYLRPHAALGCNLPSVTQASAGKCITFGEDSHAVLQLLGKTVQGLHENGSTKLPAVTKNLLPGMFGKEIGNLQVRHCSLCQAIYTLWRFATPTCRDASCCNRLRRLSAATASIPAF